MAASREVKYLKNFGGGLNFNPDTSSLRENETPDALNIDFTAGGGFQLRGGFEYLADSPTLNGAQWLCASYFADDVVLLRDSAGDLWSWDGSTLTDTGETITDNTDERTRADGFSFELSATRYNKVYLANGRSSGSIVMRTWDGTTLATLGTDFNNDYTTPAGGHMPLARHVISWGGHMWVADTVEDGVRFPHRVRFSHTQMPEDWGEDDYFEVDPSDDGDPITGVIGLGQQLLIFKRSSVYTVYGYDRDTFTLEEIPSAVGTCSCGAADVHNGKAYWFTTDGRFLSYDGRGIKDLSAPIAWWSELGKIQHGGRHRVRFMDGRIWMRLEAGSGEDVNYWTFLYDPLTYTFTRYDKVISDLFWWPRIGVDAQALFFFENSDALYSYDRANLKDDDEDGVVQRIDGYYKTAWIDAGETATRKRWKRPRVTASADSATTLNIEVFLDNDTDNVKRFLTMPVTVPADTSLWGTAVWGDSWYAPSDQYYNFDKLGAAGTGYNIQFKFSSDDNPGRWSVDQLAVPFRRKQVK